MWPFKKKSPPKVQIPSEPTPEMIEEAKNHPNGWIYMIDGKFGPNDAVPPENIVGAWAVNANGKITGEFIPNPKYNK